jgi:DNA-binding NarL/FixJ family response regulator
VNLSDVRVAFIGESRARTRAREILLSAGLAPLCDQISDAEVVLAELSGSPGEQRRRARSAVAAIAAPLVLLTDSGGAVDLQRLLETGARGIVLNSRLEATLVPTLLAVRSGQLCAPAETEGRAKPVALSRREKEVMTLVVMGLSNADIARRLHVGETTVKAHVAASLRKLGVRSRVEAAELMLDPDERAGTGVISLLERDSQD